MNHTNCTLVYDGPDLSNHSGHVVGHYFAHPDGGRIGQVFVNCLVTSPEEAKANADRLIACWNRLRSFTTEELEAGKPGFIQMIAQRNVLLLTLEKISKLTGDAGFNIGGPITYCDAANDPETAKELLIAATEYLRGISEIADIAIKTAKGGVA